MTMDRHRLEGMDAKAKRELLARLLKERASGSGETFELSSGQEALFFLNQLAPQAVPYNVASCGRIRAKIDIDRLESALLKLMERHPVLRCTFALSAEGPRQRIGRVPARGLEVIDASPWSEQELHARLDESYRRPFDLANGPVFRASVFSRHDTDHVLLIVAHHIVFDAWSLGIIIAELAVLYEGGSAASLSPQPASYADFVKWQRRMLESDEGRDAWNYWRSRLEGSLTPIDLPSDHLRPKDQSFRGGSYHFELPAALCAQLRALARAENATPYIVLAAAFHALVHRYTGSPQVPIGMPLAGRSRQEFENIVGYFVNPVVLCARVESGTTFRQHVAEMRAAAIGAQRYGDFPFPELVKRLRPERDPSRTPLFQFVLNLVKATQVGLGANASHVEGDTLLHLGSLPTEHFPLAQQEGQFDLDLTVLDTGGAMPGLLKYSTDLFEAGRVERMAGHFRTLLEGAVADPDRALSDLPLLTPDEERTILVEWNRTAGDYSTDTTLAALVEAQADRTPDALAIVSEGERITYGELDARANRVAHRLRKLGAGPGALIGVCIDRSIDMVAAQLGVLKAGAAFVPIEASYPRDRIAFMLEDARVAVILAGRRIAADLPAGGASVVLLDADASLDGESAARVEPSAGPETLAYVIYTSGSTGKPKGAMIHHRAIVNHVLWMRSRWPLGQGDAVLQSASASFDASVWEIWNTLAGGAHLVIPQPDAYGDPAAMVRTIVAQRVTHALIVPSMLELVAREPGFERCVNLRHLFPGGEALSRALVDRIRERLDVEVVNLYGPTETTINATSWVTETGEGPFAHTVPIGRPITNHRTYILDAGLRPVPVGIPGELHIGGAGVGAGYLGRPELTAEKFVPDPFVSGGRLYKTGDVCRFRGDGVIEFLGRNDHQVKVRGFRIELGEIEAALLEHAGVAQAVAASCEEVRGDVRLVAYLVPRPGGSPDTAELRVFLRGRLPEYMVPSAFMILPSLPLTPAGKVDRKALPAPDTVRPALQTRYEAPRTEVETAIAAIWKEVLRVDQVGIHDNFFDLGGHSLLLIQVQARMEQLLNRRLPVVELFEFPNIEALARHLSSDGDAAPARDRIQDRADRQRQTMSRQRERREKGGSRP